MEERKKAIQNLKIAKGQIEGIIKMIEDERYCIDVSNQIIAVQSLLKKAKKCSKRLVSNKKLFKAHTIIFKF